MGELRSGQSQRPPAREGELVSSRLLEFLRREHRDLAELVRRDVHLINDCECTLFVLGSGERRIEFYCWERDLSFAFLDYRGYLELYPHPEAAFRDFAALLRAFIVGRKDVLTWRTDELERCAELIERGNEEFYSFLWGDASEAAVRSWSGAHDRKLK